MTLRLFVPERFCQVAKINNCQFKVSGIEHNLVRITMPVNKDGSQRAMALNDPIQRVSKGLVT